MFDHHSAPIALLLLIPHTRQPSRTGHAVNVSKKRRRAETTSSSPPGSFLVVKAPVMSMRPKLKAVPATRHGIGRKKEYERPQIIYREKLELFAVACVPGKGSTIDCPVGPVKS